MHPVTSSNTRCDAAHQGVEPTLLPERTWAMSSGGAQSGARVSHEKRAEKHSLRDRTTYLRVNMDRTSLRGALRNSAETV